MPNSLSFRLSKKEVSGPLRGLYQDGKSLLYKGDASPYATDSFSGVETLTERERRSCRGGPSKEKTDKFYLTRLIYLYVFCPIETVS